MKAELPRQVKTGGSVLTEFYFTGHFINFLCLLL